MAKKYLRDLELAAYLKKKYKTARSLSEEARISTQYAYKILDGTSIPEDFILSKLGLNRVYEVQE